ncbi:RICIN domain-containing protein [Streptomyces sp. NPDC127106]|uniref:RICIN domain-containing protein n=1 Tax=Streptomyces sp. NPDC127106 TaxID=3345360 RepID=UPI003640E942
MRIIKRAIAISGILLATLGLSLAPANATSELPKIDRFVNQHSGKCLEVADWSTANGAPVRQWACTEGNNQKWDYVNGFYVNRNSGKCLEVADWSTAPGAAIRQWDCLGGNNQKWNIILCERGFSCFYSNAHSARVLEIGGYSASNGAFAVQFPYNGGSNQQWHP